MVKGIGIDLVDISSIENFMRDAVLGKNYLEHTFTPDEIRLGKQRSKQAEFFASRFAAKEACFKALAPLLPGKHFDMRIVETLSREDGSPYIHVNKEMETVLRECKIETLHISISHEGNYALAMVIAE